MAAGQSRHFTRSGALEANLDIKTYDVGNLHLCTVDGTAVNWGKLWVEYDVDFFVPQLPPTGQLALVGGRILGATSQTAANPFGTAPTLDAQAAGMAISNASVLTFQSAGSYVLSMSYTGTVITAVTTPVMGSGATLIANVSWIPTAATTAGALYTVTVTDPATATMAFALTATTITGAVLVCGTGPSGSYN